MVPGIWYHAFGFVHHAWYQILDIKYLAPNAWRPILGTKLVGTKSIAYYL